MSDRSRALSSRSSAPRLLDLFCCSGGCSMGYYQAGFDVVGVDIEPQARYPFEFIHADATTFPLDGFDAIHASPPCQMYSKAMKHLAHEQDMLIDAMRDRLEASGLPWVIENVVGAPLPTQSDLFGRHGVELCGSMFSLPVWRHRLFQTSFSLEAPRGCDHREAAMNPHNQLGRDRMYEEYGRGCNVDLVWNSAMGVGWMSKYDGREAIPPAYTAYIGRHLYAEVLSNRKEMLADAA